MGSSSATKNFKLQLRYFSAALDISMGSSKVRQHPHHTSTFNGGCKRMIGCGTRCGSSPGTTLLRGLMYKPSTPVEGKLLFFWVLQHKKSPCGAGT